MARDARAEVGAALTVNVAFVVGVGLTAVRTGSRERRDGEEEEDGAGKGGRGRAEEEWLIGWLSFTGLAAVSRGSGRGGLLLLSWLLLLLPLALSPFGGGRRGGDEGGAWCRGEE